MKKSISIHLHGHLFHLEEEGYQELSKYLQSIKTYFAAYEDNTEIVDDIEARLAEKFSSRKEKKQVVETSEILQAISEMGKVEDFAAAEENIPEEGEKVPKRLFRDKENGIIAGVCSGIANYFGVDPVWIRIAFILLTFAYFWGVLLYIILWILVPEAKTASEKIQMQGNPVTVANIAQVIGNGLEKVRAPEKMSALSRGFRSFGAWGERVVSAIGRRTGQGFRGIFRLIAIVIGFFGTVFSVAFVIMLIAGTAALLFGADREYFEPSFQSFFPENTFFPFLLTIFFTILIPLLFILSLSFWFLRRRGIFANRTLGVLAGFWVLSFGTAVGMGTLLVPTMWNEIDSKYLEYEASKITRTIPTENFGRVEAEGHYEIVIEKGAGHNITVEGAPEFLDAIEIKNSENTLNINRSFSEEVRNRSRKIYLFSYRIPPKITITTPSLEYIKASGDTRITLAGFSNQDVTLLATNSGNISIEGVFKNISADLENSGNIHVNGSFESLEASTTNSSRLHIEGDGGRASIQSERSSLVGLDGNVAELDLRITDGARIHLEGRGSLLKASLRNGSSLQADDFEVQTAEVEARNGSHAQIYAEDSTNSFADNGSHIENGRSMGSPDFREEYR